MQVNLNHSEAFAKALSAFKAFLGGDQVEDPHALLIARARLSAAIVEHEVPQLPAEVVSKLERLRACGALAGLDFPTVLARMLPPNTVKRRAELVAQIEDEYLTTWSR